MDIVCTSDLHSRLPEIPKCDVLVIAGDICGDASEEIQLNNLQGKFSAWCGGLRLSGICKHIVVIAGNHDYAMEYYPKREFDNSPFIYLEDSSVEIDGLVFYGSPWSLQFGDYSFMCTEEGMEDICDNIPENVDVLLTHGPPFGIMDGAPRRNKKGLEHCGSKVLLDRVLTVRPKLHVFGHIHEGYGRRHWQDEQGDIYFVNPSHRNGDFTRVRKPIRVKL